MTEPIWLSKARELLGTKEVFGAGDNPTILGWAKEIGGWEASYYTHDEIPWCGLFAGICMKRSGITPPANYLGAKNWSVWGQAVITPSMGAVLVFQRPGGGHVGFYVGEDVDAYHVLGGNEGDQVEICREAKSRLVAIRWPFGSQPEGGSVMLSTNGEALSNNEA